MTGFVFSSCENDDDDSNSGSIVGTWLWEEYDPDDDETYMVYYMFCDNGTVYEFEGEDGDYEVDKASYIYTSSSNKLVVTYPGEGSYSYEVTVSGNKMILESRDEVTKLTKVKSPLTESQLEKLCEQQSTDLGSGSLVGTWTYTERDGSYTYSEQITFRSDGTYSLVWQEMSYSGVESGTWSYSEKQHTLIIKEIVGEKPGTHTYSVVFDGKSLYLIEPDGDVNGPYTKR